MKKEKMTLREKFWKPHAIFLFSCRGYSPLSFGIESNMCLFLALLVFKYYFQITKSKGKMKQCIRGCCLINGNVIGVSAPEKPEWQQMMV